MTLSLSFSHTGGGGGGGGGGGLGGMNLRVAAYMLELYIGRKKKQFSPEVASYTCKDISL